MEQREIKYPMARKLRLTTPIFKTICDRFEQLALKSYRIYKSLNTFNQITMNKNKLPYTPIMTKSLERALKKFSHVANKLSNAVRELEDELNKNDGTTKI